MRREPRGRPVAPISVFNQFFQDCLRRNIFLQEATSTLGKFLHQCLKAETEFQESDADLCEVARGCLSDKIYARQAGSSLQTTMDAAHGRLNTAPTLWLDPPDMLVESGFLPDAVPAPLISPESPGPVPMEAEMGRLNSAFQEGDWLEFFLESELEKLGFGQPDGDEEETPDMDRGRPRPNRPRPWNREPRQGRLKRTREMDRCPQTCPKQPSARNEKRGAESAPEKEPAAKAPRVDGAQSGCKSMAGKERPGKSSQKFPPNKLEKWMQQEKEDLAQQLLEMWMAALRGEGYAPKVEQSGVPKGGMDTHILRQENVELELCTGTGTGEEEGVKKLDFHPVGTCIISCASKSNNQDALYLFVLLEQEVVMGGCDLCLLYTSPSPRD